ncbi:MAG: hypothetical protein A3C84_00250 [Candidatus Ryanbacteria bacterium RIFCSPHIGHO2_02_FULL_48_12]|uniref:Fatty acid desaturase domain-containing protein n=1 Tax=Candidatus Ryanbacteria bacterium RIFCSPHIGHO2_01_FULL_48_27 TaxID=1802115 RepID=A0A1G2G5A6_9BACT|nr:MAG: hypothetical protein A2756_00190 [Candidatus Ryanbacteria bacterium RIFCSPHIGHO2_01_FULL_48_27]OGZ50407.1 MAG: hypothetical protein A3C84_00250 [Candidatus Ryanbacteria bacterium RIFCSPHIGHO2_02_FULL_48_12]
MSTSRSIGREQARVSHGRILQPWTLLGIVLLHVGAGIAIWYGASFGFSWRSIMLTGIYTLLTGIGVSVAYHRMLTHQSFRTNSKLLEYALVYWGGVAGQNAFTWVLNHRSHHEFGDTEHDPYSYYWPYHGGVRGFLWAHVIALVYTFGRPAKYASLPRSDPYYDVILWEQKWHTPIFLSGFFIPAFIAGWEGFWLTFLRVVYVFHVTWMVNSVCHMWGQRAARGIIPGRNSLFVIVLAFVGEGFHINHHLNPSSAYLGWKWWHFDVGKWVIQLFELLGLVYDVHRPRAPSSG